MSFALDTEADPAKSIDEFILKPGSARCCKKCLHGESREACGREKKLVESYMCKVCSSRRGPRPLKCFDKHQVKLYKDLDELKELVCFDCVDVSKFTGADFSRVSNKVYIIKSILNINIR